VNRLAKKKKKNRATDNEKRGRDLAGTGNPKLAGPNEPAT